MLLKLFSVLLCFLSILSELEIVLCYGTTALQFVLPCCQALFFLFPSRCFSCFFLVQEDGSGKFVGREREKNTKKRNRKKRKKRRKAGGLVSMFAIAITRKC